VNSLWYVHSYIEIISMSQKHFCKIDLKSQAGVLFYNKMVQIKCMNKVLNEVNSIMNDSLIQHCTISQLFPVF